MTHAEERRLYETDRSTWIKWQCENRAAAIMKNMRESESEKRRIWALCCERMREAIRELARKSA